MSTIPDWTLHSRSAAGIHLFDFKESFPEWNHYTAKQSDHLRLSLYLQLRYLQWISVLNQGKSWSWTEGRVGSKKNSSALPLANGVPLWKFWFSSAKPPLVLWRCGGVWSESRPRPGSLKLCVLFKVDKSALTCGSILPGLWVKSGGRQYSRTYTVGSTDSRLPFPLKTVECTDMYKKNSYSRTAVLRHSGSQHIKESSTLTSTGLPKQKSRQKHFRKCLQSWKENGVLWPYGRRVYVEFRLWQRMDLSLNPGDILHCVVSVCH